MSYNRQMKYSILIFSFLSMTAFAKFEMSSDEKDLTSLSESHYYWGFRLSEIGGGNRYCSNGTSDPQECEKYYSKGFPVNSGIICKISIKRSISNQTENKKTVRINKIETGKVDCNVQGLTVKMESLFCGETILPQKLNEEAVGDSKSLYFEKEGKKLGMFEVLCRRKSEKND